MTPYRFVPIVFTTLIALAGAVSATDPGLPLDPRVEAALAGSLLDVPAPSASTDAARPAPEAFAPTDEVPLAPGSPPAGAAPVADPLSTSFSRFCSEWMQKLEARERRNAGMIEWDTGLNWVQGSYVGYAQNLACAVEAADSPSPVGRLSYLEVKYERRGATVDAALEAKPEAVETTEVTEFFRYGDNGQWLY